MCLRKRQTDARETLKIDGSRPTPRAPSQSDADPVVATALVIGVNIPYQQQAPHTQRTGAFFSYALSETWHLAAHTPFPRPVSLKCPHKRLRSDEPKSLLAET